MGHPVPLRKLIEMIGGSPTSFHTTRFGVGAPGVARLAPSQPGGLLAVDVAAAGLAAWKGGWEGGVLATAIATVILLWMFGATFDESHLIGFIAAGVIVTAIVEAARPHRRAKRVAAADVPPEFGKLASVDPPLSERDRLSA